MSKKKYINSNTYKNSHSTNLFIFFYSILDEIAQYIYSFVKLKISSTLISVVKTKQKLKFYSNLK